MSDKSNYSVDKKTFISSIIILAAGCGLIAFSSGKVDLQSVKRVIADELGGIYLTSGILALIFTAFVASSRVGDIVLDRKNADEPQYSMAEWMGLLFCAGVGGTILYWSMAEWMIYIQNPPFDAQPFSPQAARWSTAYSMFHWGPIAWSFYLIPALPIAYIFHVRGRKTLKISTALGPALGEKRAAGPVGKMLDTAFIIGIVGGKVATFGLVAPLIAGGAGELVGIEPDWSWTMCALALPYVLFAAFSRTNSEKAEKFMGRFNLWATLALLVFVLAVGPTRFLIGNGIESFGFMLDNFFKMATYSESLEGIIGDRSYFPQDWTIFYWSWCLVFAPAMGLFIAKISRGRTVRQMIVGSIVCGSFGCALVFAVMGSFGLHEFISEGVDLPAVLNSSGIPAAIIAAIKQLPYGSAVLAGYLLLVLLFAVSTLQALSFLIGAVSQNRVDEDEEEPVSFAMRLFWATFIMLIAAVMIQAGGLEVLQLTTIAAALPIVGLIVLMGAAGMRICLLDMKHQSGYKPSAVRMTRFPEEDPWSRLGELEALLRRLKEKGSRLARREKELVDDIAGINGMLRDSSDSSVEVLLEEKIRSWRRVRKVRADLHEEIEEVRGRRAALKRRRAEKIRMDEQLERLSGEFADAADPRSKELQRKVARLRLQNSS